MTQFPHICSYDCYHHHMMHMSSASLFQKKNQITKWKLIKFFLWFFYSGISFILLKNASNTQFWTCLKKIKKIYENFWWETTKTLDVSAHFSMKWYKNDNDEGKFLWNNFDFPHKHTHTKKIFTRLTHTHAIYLRLQNNVAIWKTTLRKNITKIWWFFEFATRNLTWLSFPINCYIENVETMLLMCPI